MPFLVLFLILFGITPCFSQTPNESSDQVWEVGDRRWTVEEEHRFGKWLDETMTEDFFLRYRTPTVCADAVYAIRWIYARINHLPAAATTKEGRLIGHWSTDWSFLPTHPEWDRDERFRAALLYLFPRTWTGTLPFDTYPVRISRDSITPGTLFLVTESHTGIIGHVVLDGSQAHPLQAWESALPLKVQKLNLRYFFSGKPETKARSGLVKFRWPVSENGEWKYLSAPEHPFYSEEQYSSGFCKGYADFVEAVARKIDPTDYLPIEKMVKVMGTLTRLLRERVPIVLEGYEQCCDGGCPEASELWEIYSTSGRDEMIISLADHLSKIIESNHLDKEMTREMMESIPIDISEHRSVTLYHVYQNHLWFSPHPEDAIEARWGLKKCEMVYAQTRTTQDSISFIEKTYRKRDPRFANFSIQQQQRILQRLNEEWNRSECTEGSLTPVRKVWVSAPPKPSAEPRRGSRKCEAIHTEIRATKGSISFIERTYRQTDPKYADFALQQQELILQRLSEEWNRSECAEGSLTPVRKVRVSPPPKPSTEPRRGLKKCEAIHTEIRATKGSISFIEKTYRKSDPEYADFSLQQQEQILQRLSEEWNRSKCTEPPPAPGKRVKR